jgi:Coenzyme PQQ synthesis protein D (PqqD)
MSQAIAAGAHVRISPSVYARPFGEELVLLHFGKGEYFGLDEMGASIWRALEANEDLNGIADRLVEQYEVERDVALADVMTLVTALRDASLLEVA